MPIPIRTRSAPVSFLPAARRVLAPLLLLLTASAARAAIALTEVPAGMRKQTAEIAVGWSGASGRVHLRASTVPGGGASIAHYDSLHLPSQPGTGRLAFRINPDIPSAYRNTDLRLGMNYCIVTDGIQASPEFVIIVESSTAPTLNSPANAASIKDLTPTFSWSGDAPYYTVMVSDEPFKISAEGTVTGVSAIWQIITPYTSARYGDADPSGLNPVAAPPLVSGKTYNWLVLNNYGNSAAATSKVAPVPASFVYLPAPPLPQAVLIAPADRDTVRGADAIDFRWGLVEGAVSYKVELLEENLVDGSQADVVLWKASSTAGQVRLVDATGLLRRYTYKWRVYAVGNNGSASLSGKRSFFYDIPVGNLTVSVKNDNGQKLAYVPVKVNRIGGASSAAFQNGSTDADGTLTISNAPLGTYEAKVENADGYQPRTDTVSHVSASGTTHAMTLTPVLGKLVGRVTSTASGTGVLNAKVTITAADGSAWSALTNSQGTYSLGLPYGNWQAQAQAAGHAASLAAAVTLNSTTPSRTADFALTPHRHTLSGTVQNSFSRQGIFGATVQLSQGGETRTAATDGNGAYAFTVSPGTFTLRASNAGFAAPEPQTVVVEGDKILNLALDPNASILSGRARDPAGSAVPGALVQAVPKAGPARGVTADAQGVFEISLPAGDWTLTASAKGYTNRTSHKFLLDASKTVQGVDFSLEANRAFLAGRVTEGGSGLPGVKVSAGEASGLTDNGGWFLFPAGAGTHEVQARKEGYLVPKTYSVTLSPGDTAAGIDFTATGSAGVVKGRVLSGGAAVSGARVEAVNQGNKEAFALLTDGAGVFALSLPGGDYRIAAAKEGFAPDQVLTLTLPPGGTVLDADLRLVPDQGIIQGTVAGGGAALGGCEVAYRSASGTSLAGRTVTDPQGRYTLSLQAGVAYGLTAACAGYQPASVASAVLTRGGTLTADFAVAKAGALLKGKAVDSRGALAGVKVTAVRDGEAVSALSDLAGAWQLALGSGTYGLSLSRSGYRTVSATVQLAPGDNLRPADTLAASVGRLTGRVVSGGAGVPSALVTLVGLTPDAGGAVFRTDADGRFSRDDLPAGSYGLTASAEGYADGRLASLTVTAGSPTAVEVACAPNLGVLSGTVSLSGASPTTVKVVANGYGVSRSAAPGADGRWILDRLPGGTYSVSAGLAGYSAGGAREGLILGPTATLAGLDFTLTKNAGSLAGTVTGAGTAAGIRVSLAGKSGHRAYGTCDAAGRYAIPSLPEDVYTLTVVAPGYKLSGATQAPEVAISAAATRDLALLPAVFRLSGKVSNQAGIPLSGLPVEARHPLGFSRTTTAADGSYAFAELPAGGEYQVSLKPPTADHDPKDTTFAQGLDGAAQVTANLATVSRLASLSGLVLLDGSPVEGATLRLVGGHNNLTSLSQPGGGFRIPGIAGSQTTLALTLSRAGARTLDTTVVVGPGEAKSGLILRLATLKVALTGTLLDSENKPLAGAKAVLTGGARPDTVTASQAGTFTVADLAANRSLSLATLLDKARYDNVEVPLFIREKDTAVTVRAVVHAASVAITVKDQDGGAVGDAEVTLNGKVIGKTSAAGVLLADLLPRGEYRFMAGKASYRSGPEARLILPGDTSATLALALTRVVGGLYGTVSDSGLDRSGGAAAFRTLPGAVVQLISGADTLRDTANSLGQYVIDGLAEGRTYGVNVLLPGYMPVRDSVTGTAQAQSRDIIVRPFPGAVVGRLAPGRAGIAVRLGHSAGGSLVESRTVEGGYYGFLGLQHRSDYLVQAVAGDSSSPAGALQGNGSAAKRVDLALDRLGALAGKALGAAVGALPGARVQTRHLLTGAVAWTLSDAEGRYSLTGLPAGEHALTAERDGFRAAVRSVIVLQGAANSGADLTLEESDAGVTGVAVDKDGRPLAAALTLARSGDTLRAQAGGSGVFLFAGAAQASHVLAGSLPGHAAEAATVSHSGKGLTLATLAFTRTSGRVTGVVRDAMTNTPLAGAAVRIAGSTGADAIADAQGRYALAVPAGAASPVMLEASQEGYLARSGMPVWLETDRGATQDLALSADYRMDGQINVTVREGQESLAGLILALVPFHPDDAALPGLSGAVPFSFRNLRRPAPYALKVKREGFKELTRVVDLPAAGGALEVAMAYPTSRIRLFVTADGKTGKGVEAALDGQGLAPSPDTAGLYLSAAKLKSGRYEATLRDLDTSLIPMAAHFIALGEDSVRTDTLFASFRALSIPDSLIDTAFRVGIARTDSVRPAPGVKAQIFYRLQGASLWDSLALDSVPGGFARDLPAQSRAGVYEYFHRVVSPAGVRIGVATSGGLSHGTAEARYSNALSPRTFRLRDPYLLQSIALLPQRLEADTSLYSLGARDLFQVQLRGEAGRSLDAHFDRRAAAGEEDFLVEWGFGDPQLAAAAGLSLAPDPESPRLCRFRGGSLAPDTVFQVKVAVRMGAVTLRKSFLVKVQDLSPVAIGITYVKENKSLEEDGAALLLSNGNPEGYGFAAFARTADGRVYNIAPRWSLGGDSAAGTLSPLGVFTPNPAVARGATLRILDTLSAGGGFKAFSFSANLATYAQVVPAASGTSVVTDGEGAVLEFGLAGLSKAFTVSVKKPKVSGLLRASPVQEVVGDILDIELSESQPFKADSGAVLRLPVGRGIARRSTVYLGHWNTQKLAWEKVAESKADSTVAGKVYGFSKYAVLMGSLPLGAYDLVARPNPFSSEDPWGLQLGYKVSSDVSAQVGVRIEVYNMMGDKVYESQEQQLSKGQEVVPGTRKAAPASSDRRTALGPLVWDGRDTDGKRCRNGRYLLKLIVKDGQGRKEYLRKVVMLK